VKYKAAKGSHITDDQAQRYGEFIAQLVEDTNNHVDPKILVENAKGSPIEEYFEWNSRKAATGYRIVQARELLRWIVVEVEGIQTRAFQPVTIQITETDKDNIYTTIQYAMTDVSMMEQIEKVALSLLRAWVRKYKQYQTLREIAEGIEKIIQ
jgi:hypothetical protein